MRAMVNQSYSYPDVLELEESNQVPGTTLFIFRTDIKTKKRMKVVTPVFNNHPLITQWSIDLQDIDNVLKIEALGNMRENEIISMIKTLGFYCEVLPD